MKLDGKRVLLTGAKGTLGSQLAPLLKEAGAFLRCPKRDEMPVDDIILTSQFIQEWNPEIIIHAAAFTDVPKAELPKFRKKVIETNIQGVEHVKYGADRVGAKLVYISTDYVYEGVGGDYETTDPTNPRTFYGFSKLAGESYLGKKDLIIRTSFTKRGTWGPGRRQLQGVFKGIHTSKDWVDVIAPLIIESLKKTGIVNIGTERKTLHSLASQEYKEVNVIPTNSVELGYEYPKDSSMKLSV